jgi:Rod binding domain-containing protein
MHLSGSSPAPARSHLLPSDLPGILTHGHHSRRGPSPLIHPDRPGHAGSPNTPHDEQLIDQARKWVAQTFFGTLMKQMRNSPFKSPLFEGGRGGEAFGEMYDQRLVEHMSRGAGNKLVGAIVRKIVAKESKDNAAMATAAYAKQSKIAGAAQGPHTGANANGQRGAGSFMPKRGIPVPDIKNAVAKVRAHVTPGL